MTTILTRLSIANLVALFAAYGLGLASRLRHSLETPADPTFEVHFYLGLFTVLSTLALHCGVFIYFLGTGRWVKEVAIAYRIADDPLPKLTRDLKRRTYPVALIAMLVPIAAAAAGAAAQRHEWPWQVHFGLATLTLLVNLWAFAVERKNAAINAGVLRDVLAEVDRIRLAAGMVSNAEALQQSSQ